ncbi:hypothetical protein JHK82_016565 [Glycine max]|nr:hypothetical protein JHK85_016982 [Glycine max]KAG5149684.1 hypothetical protein JHK82_016565 [Glycine max]
MALHLSTALTLVVCRARSRIWFWNCKGCVEHKKAESLYICGCPGKSLSMEKVKDKLLNWAKENGTLQKVVAASRDLRNALCIRGSIVDSVIALFRVDFSRWRACKSPGVSETVLVA